MKLFTTAEDLSPGRSLIRHARDKRSYSKRATSAQNV